MLIDRVNILGFLQDEEGRLNLVNRVKLLAFAIAPLLCV
jgi:hypothetical protein